MALSPMSGLITVPEVKKFMFAYFNHRFEFQIPGKASVEVAVSSQKKDSM
jgi:hypothetical protein